MAFIVKVTWMFCVLVIAMANKNPGTTKHLQDIFVGRCWDYMEVRYKDIPPRSNINCDNLWDVFYKAFSYQAPCDVAMAHYADYIHMASQDLPINKTLFWSGTYDIAHEYAEAGKRLFTLEDSLIGFLANKLIWCGSSSTGANLTRCPSWTDCPLESSESFWASASKEFAGSASGDVYLMLDGSRSGKPAYSRDSFFSKYELPNLTDINKIVIIVTHTLDGNTKETCTSGSILDLQEDITKRNLKFDCLDDPLAILHLLCADDPEARECKMVNPLGRPPVPVEPRFNTRPDRFTY